MPATKTKTKQEELFLIDGNSLAYRAFFALPESIATADGRPTNAIYGFASMMAKILIDHSPKAVIVAWDKGWSGRENVYAEYKSQRKSRPDLLREQWPHLAPLAEAFGFRNVAVEGFEADDVIATLTRQATDAGISVMIVSGDRDVYQLVRDGVRVMTTSRGVTDTKIYDHDGVIERYGVPPELVTDFIGLKGDTSDNIPGVPGIGDKTAAQLLQEFGSLEGVLESVEKISGAKRKQNLTEHADDARVSKQLATMVDDVEVPIAVTEQVRSVPDRSKLRDAANEFELRAVIQRLDDEWDEVVPGRMVEETIEVEAQEGSPADLADGPISIAIGGGRWAASDGKRVVAGDASDLGGLAAQLRERPLIAHDTKSLGGHGPHSLLAAARPEGLDLAHDTMVAAYLIDPARRTYDLHELAADAGLAAAPAGADDGQLSLAAEEGDVAGDPAVDARLAGELAGRQRARLREFGVERLLNEVEMPLIEVLAEMERDRTQLDTEKLAEIGAGMADQIAELEREIYELAGHEFTIGSPQQLATVFFDELGLTKKRRGKTGFSTDARVLGQLRDEHPIVEKVERWRELTKLKNTYLDSLPELVDERRPHPHHVQPGRDHDGTALEHESEPAEHPDPLRGRAAGPRLLRRRPGPAAAVLRLQPGRASGAGPRRRRGRAARDLRLGRGRARGDRRRDRRRPTRTRSRRPSARRRRWSTTGSPTGSRPSASPTASTSIARRPPPTSSATSSASRPSSASSTRRSPRAEQRGYVTTLMGRRRNVPELRSGQRQRRLLGERLAVNTVIQGTAADIIKVAMVRAHKALADAGLQTELVLQIHDELLFEGPAGEMDAAAEIAKREMVGAFDLDPPLAVDVGVGGDWLAAK